MKTTVPVRRPPGRLLLTALVIMALLPLSGLLNVQIARAAYVNRFSTITNGAITFTGNTLGLSKQAGANAPGIRGGIGAFITTNIALVDGTYPAGTTPDWRLDSAAAVLNIPAGSNVLYAELIWSGSYSYGGENVSPFLNNPVNLTAPGGAAVAIAPDPATANTLGNANANGTCASDTDISPPVVTPCFYVRSANVTAQVQAAGAGTYVVGGVPGTQADTPGSAQETRNNTGWTLAVVYGNPGLPARNLTLFVGAEVTNSSTSTPVGVAGFCTPPTGPVAGRLLVSATEGDADIRGDQMRFGPTAATLTPLSGPNNPVGNFFGSQLNGDTGTVDTTGTFGARNQNAIAGTNISGGRQGWDITNVNISGQLTNAQTSAVAQGTSTGDQYVVNALATQIDVGAPNFPIDVKQVDKVSTFVGDTLTYTIRVDNGLGTADAINVLFKDPPPAGTSFVPNSFTIDGVAQPGADPAAGVNLGTIAMGTQKIVGFQVHVDQLPNPIHYDNSASWTYQYVSCAGQQPLNGNIVTNQVRTDAPLLQPTKTVAPTGTVKPGDVLTYTITAPNSGTAATSGATLADPIPAGATYVPGSTTLNGAAVADVGGAMPFATAKAINGPGAPAGQIAPGAAATVQFKVTVNAGVTAPIVNVATVDPDGPTGPMPPTDVQTQNPVSSPSLAATKTGALVVDTAPVGGSAGDTIEYTIAVSNSGGAPATGVALVDDVPANTTYVPGSTTLNGAAVADVGGAPPFAGAGAPINSPGAPAGQIAPGAAATVTFRVTVNTPVPSGVAEISNQATVTVPGGPPLTPPPARVPLINPPILEATKAAALVVDADGNGSPSAGDTLRYDITISNTSTAAATSVVYNDIPDPNTKLVVGSVTTSQGTVVDGNAAGNRNVGVDIGTLAPNARVTISYRVTIDKPLDPTIKRLVNQGLVSSKELPPIPTDDPRTPTPGDPTVVPITPVPVLTADKSASLFTDTDGNGSPSAGDTLSYQIVIKNVGNAAATGVTYADTPDANTTLVAGTVATSQGTVTGGNAGTPPVAVDIGAMPIGTSVTISYRVTINSPLPNTVERLVNQGFVKSNELPDIPTNDPKTPASGDPTIVPVTPTPTLTADKADFLYVDANNNGVPSAGDTLLYRVVIQNVGNVAATAVTFTDTPDVITKLVVGSVQTSQGVLTTGNSAGDTSVAVAIGDIPARGSVIVTFAVQLNNPLPRNIISNQGTTGGSNTPKVPTNDPDTPAAGDPTLTIIPPSDLTAVTLTSFTATREGAHIAVRWTTAAEINTWGFYLYRSADGSRAHAVRVTPELILGQGRGQGGASYSWNDTGAQPGVTYTYWLQEVEINGTVHEYGPAAAVLSPSAQRGIFIPVVTR